MTLLSDVGLVAADTSRSRAYLSALERHALLPSWTVLLDDGSKKRSPGQLDEDTHMRAIETTQDELWSEAAFDPGVPIEPWLQRLKLNYVVANSRDINSPGVIGLIARSAPSVLIYSGYGGSLLGRDVLSVGKRFLHVHGGFLPDYKGSTTNYYSLLAENALGASALFLTEDIDGGPILGRRRFSPPKNRQDIDHRYDSAARAKVLIDVLEQFQKVGDWRSVTVQGGTTYYIIHPVLKHLAIIGEDVESPSPATAPMEKCE